MQTVTTKPVFLGQLSQEHKGVLREGIIMVRTGFDEPLRSLICTVELGIEGMNVKVWRGIWNH